MDSIRSWFALALTTAATVCFAVGCGSRKPDAPGSPSPSSEKNSHDGHDHDAHRGHNHEDEHEGPHGGHVVELGRDHQYHLEIVEDEQAKSVILYALDRNMKPLRLDVPSVVFNLVVEGKPRSFELPADSPGTFRSKTADLFSALHDRGATGKVRIVIDGSPYTGDVEHHHHGAEDGHEH